MIDFPPPQFYMNPLNTQALAMVLPPKPEQIGLKLIVIRLGVKPNFQFIIALYFLVDQKADQILTRSP